MPSLYNTPLTVLSGVGPKKAELFHRLGADSVGALLRLYPRTYEDWSRPVMIAEADSSIQCCIRAEVEKAFSPARIRGNMIIYKLNVSDGLDIMTVSFFNQQFVYDKLKKGGEFLFYGYVKKAGGQYTMSSPSVAPGDSDIIRPIYQQTGTLTSKQTENAVRAAIRMLPEKINDPIPEDIRKEFDLCGLGDAIRNVHFPESEEALIKAKRRLAFEELLVLQLGMAKLNGGRKETECYHIARDYSEEFERLLPFTLTGAQKRTIKECISDMSKLKYPMNRLVQGDVGSGKTAVAASLCYTAAKNGIQCAIMAPTEILALQHYESVGSMLEKAGLKTALLTGSTRSAEKRRIKASLESGETDVVIGTHALISEDVEFKNLGLVVTDEQHRFGVAQRAALISKGKSPHIMVMSATPIPRTLALMIYGDLDLSVLDELPPGRQKTETYLVDGEKRGRIYNFMDKHIENGNQCYVVCPLVEQNDSPLISAEKYAEDLKKTVLGKRRIGILHGKMKPTEKDAVMTGFSDGNTDILIATTVIEVGVNVPNATIMLIENADRFGLSQLHQLRGRVGRGRDKSYCIMVSDSENESTMQRLGVMCRTNDGFKIADEDLRLRGPGDFFGARQHGLPELKSARLSDMVSVSDAGEAARRILADDPELEKKEHRALRFETGRLFSALGSSERLQ